MLRASLNQTTFIKIADRRQTTLLTAVGTHHLSPKAILREIVVDLRVVIARTRSFVAHLNFRTEGRSVYDI